MMVQSVPSASHSKDAKFISYNPNPNAPGGMGGKQQRIIRMVEEQVKKNRISCAYNFCLHGRRNQ
jgi:hypothetical protein